MTVKREIENYLYPDAIAEGLNCPPITFGDQDDVPEIVASAVHAAEGTTPWQQLDEEPKRKKVSGPKKRLSDAAARCMTHQRLTERDPNGELQKWFERLAEMCTS
jgi:hypothetical protein